MFCHECGTALNESDTQCAVCGAIVRKPAPIQQSPLPAPHAAPSKVTINIPIEKGGSVHKFFDFEIMVTPVIVKWTYIVLAAIMLIGTLIGMFTNGFLVFLGVLVVGILAQLFLRIGFELMMIYFRMHKELVEIRKRIK